MNDYQKTVVPLVAQALQQAWPTEPAFDPEAARQRYLPAPVMQAAPVVYVPQPMPATFQQPTVAPFDPWPKRLWGAGGFLAGAGFGFYWLGQGIHAAGYGIWALAIIVASAAWMRSSSRSGVNVNIRIDNR